MNKTTILILSITLIMISAYIVLTKQTSSSTLTNKIATAPTIENKDYIGLTVVAAEARAQDLNEPFRVVKIDGILQPTTKDLREGRINAVVESGVVIAYTVESGRTIETTIPPTTVDTNSVVGMSVTEAQAFAAVNNIPFRIGMLDGVPRALTMDYRVGRITATVQNDVVTAYTVE